MIILPNRRIIRPYDKPSFEYTQRWGINRNHPLARGLIGCWLFNEGAGSKVFDLSQYANDGSLLGATPPEWKTSKDGTVLDFSTDYIDCGTGSPELNPSAISIVSRIKIDSFPGSGDWGTIAGKWLTAGNERAYWLTLYDTNSINFYWSSNGLNNYVSTTTGSTNTWYNVVATKETATSKIYLNGDLKNSESQADSIYTSSPTELRIGSEVSRRYFDGMIAYVFIYNRGLSADEVAWLNNDPYAMFRRPNVEYYSAPDIGTTAAPTTLAPTTIAPTTVAPTTVEPTTLAPTTLEPTTSPPTTTPPTTSPVATTPPPTTLAPTTLAPTTLAPTTLPPTTLAPTTVPTTAPPTTLAPTTIAPTTLAPTTLAPTTVASTTVAPTTLPPTTLAPTTLAPTTLAPTTLAPTTVAPTTVAPTTAAPTTLTPTTVPTTSPPTTLAPTTLAPTTISTTLAPTTTLTTLAPTTILTTLAPTTPPPRNPDLDVTFDCSANNNAGFLFLDPTGMWISGSSLSATYSMTDGELSLDMSISGVVPISAIHTMADGELSLDMNLSAFAVAGDQKKNWVGWSKIGNVSFEIDLVNDAGYKPMSWSGYVYQVLKLDKNVVIYGSNGVSMAYPVVSPSPTFGFKDLPITGVKNKTAVAGDQFVHFCIDNLGCLFKITMEGPVRLGYEEFLLPLTNPVLTWDSTDQRLYISDATEGYVYNEEALTGGYSNLTGLYRINSSLTAISPDTLETEPVEICIDIIDFGRRRIKSIELVQFDASADEDLYAAIDYKYDKVDSFQTTDWAVLNNEGVAHLRAAGVEFRVRLKGINLGSFDLSHINIQFKFIDRRYDRDLDDRRYARDLEEL